MVICEIAHLTTVHPRADTRILLKLCTSLARSGHDTHLVVADGKGAGSVAGVSIHDVGASSGRLDRIRHAPGRVLAQALALDATGAAALDGLQRLLEARIAGYLAQAQKSIADKRLLTPEDDSAVFYYREILALQANNAEALAGLQQVAELYRDLAKDAYARFNFPLALSMIERGLEVQPEHAELLQMQREHQRLQASARAAKAQRQQQQAQQSKAEPEPPKEEPNTLKRVWNNLFGQ